MENFIDHWLFSIVYTHTTCKLGMGPATWKLGMGPGDGTGQDEAIRLLIRTTPFLIRAVKVIRKSVCENMTSRFLLLAPSCACTHVCVCLSVCICVSVCVYSCSGCFRNILGDLDLLIVRAYTARARVCLIHCRLFTFRGVSILLRYGECFCFEHPWPAKLS